MKPPPDSPGYERLPWPVFLALFLIPALAAAGVLFALAAILRAMLFG